MTSPPKHRTQNQTPPHHPLRQTMDRKAKARREIPLIKRIARNRMKALKLQFPTDSWSHTPSQPLRQGDVILHQFSDLERFDGAVRTFTRLQSISGLAGLRPRLRSQDHNRLQIQLQYPDYKIWRVVDRLRYSSGWTVMPLQVHQIRQLRDTLLNDINTLCASHIAFSNDMSFLRIVQPQNLYSTILPLLETFDRDVCIERDSNIINWAELKKRTVRKIERQFQVFEFLAQFDSLTQSQRESYMKFHPKYVLPILKANTSGWPLVMLQVGRYTPELARYAIKYVSEALYELKERSHLPSKDCCEELTRYSNVLRHVLRLSTKINSAKRGKHLLANRANLCILYAAMSVHRHAKIMEHKDSKGLLRLDCPGLPDTYTSCEGFDSVITAYSETREAIRILYDASEKLEGHASQLICDEKSGSYGSCSIKLSS
ncbi:hypothetical protein NUW58_g6156 [Xylaria curta]|uniref:Uncharacterized protein n=1 Tax=Xylaria curta TaxID=42375 RepID=A0ACC1NXB8_9PEZI|nr:hypothetical protein NUW58_g6156 [Xylaria curta]